VRLTPLKYLLKSLRLYIRGEEVSMKCKKSVNHYRLIRRWEVVLRDLGLIPLGLYCSNKILANMPLYIKKMRAFNEM
jgi:hypothetical protein